MGSINYTVASGKVNLAISGLLLLTFMCIHLVQFRFGATQPFVLCPPPYFINVQGILTLSLFWVDTPGCHRVSVRDIYRLEFELFQSGGWVAFYIVAVCVFSTHMCLGWKKAIPAPSLDIPQRHHNKATHIGYLMTAFIALIYISFPVYGYLAKLSNMSGSINGPEGPL